MARKGILATITSGSTLGTGVKDISINQTGTKIAINSRGYDWVRYLIGQKDITLSVEMEGDAPLAPIFETAFHAGTSVPVTYSPGDSAITDSITFDFLVAGFSHSDPVNGEATVTADLVISAATGDNSSSSSSST